MAAEGVRRAETEHVIVDTTVLEWANRIGNQQPKDKNGLHAPYTHGRSSVSTRAKPESLTNLVSRRASR